MVELKKSHGDNDHFFRYGPPKRMVKKEKWDLDVMGRFANGERWKPRHASFVMRRLQRALVKYRKDSLDLKEEPGKVYMVLYFFLKFCLDVPPSRWRPRWNMACLRPSGISHYQYLGFIPPEVASLSGHRISDSRLVNTYTGSVLFYVLTIVSWL